ncbi:MAG: YkgJ family cysteine cluster protein [Alphaproteobacteria bacterium]|nr:MAG: YkgJ family cysteine cluster protein [Alphaproteobacteria bacterium]
MAKKKLQYDCNKCPAYCCSYARIVIRKSDLKRLAKHFGIDEETARRRFTKRGEEKGEIILRHQKDEYFGTICRFLDTETRQCTIYKARPAICREFPGPGRCGYYEFLKFERKTQEDPDWVSTTWNLR